jgi:LysR family transcriptional regulator, transcriptional activator of the cysJI operon
MNMEGLRLFCLVVDEGSISQAARLSFVSQPAVTRQIKQLEDFYKVQLFARDSGKLILTEAGKLLYPYAKEIIYYGKRSIDAVQEITDSHSSVLQIGASPTIGEYLLPQLLGNFMKSSPELKFSISIANTPTILGQLKDNNIDVALVEGGVSDKTLKKEMFFQDELIIVISLKHRWAERISVSVNELEEEKMIWREADSGTRYIVQKALEEHHVLERIRSTLELGSYQSIKSAVEADLGISILPSLTVLKELEYGTLKEIKVNDLQITRDLHLVQKNQRFKKNSATEFIDFIRDIYT